MTSSMFIELGPFHFQMSNEEKDEFHKFVELFQLVDIKTKYKNFVLFVDSYSKLNRSPENIPADVRLKLINLIPAMKTIAENPTEDMVNDLCLNIHLLLKAINPVALLNKPGAVTARVEWSGSVTPTDDPTSWLNYFTVYRSIIADIHRQYPGISESECMEHVFGKMTISFEPLGVVQPEIIIPRIRLSRDVKYVTFQMSHDTRYRVNVSMNEISRSVEINTSDPIFKLEASSIDDNKNVIGTFTITPISTFTNNNGKCDISSMLIAVGRTTK